jgi:hypothetical protein
VPNQKGRRPRDVAPRLTAHQPSIPKSTDEKLARFKTRHRLALRRAVYYRHLRWSEKRKKEESRAQLVTTEVRLGIEQERGSIRSFLVNLLNRIIPFGTQSA